MSVSIPHWRDGRRWTGSGDRAGDVYDPATGAVAGRSAFATREDVDAVVADAVEAGRAWAAQSLTRRTTVMFAFREAVSRRRKEIAASITAEHGKVLDDALGEVQRGLEVAEFACGAPHLLKGGFSDGVSGGVDVFSIRQSLGVVAVISPFNFPAMVPMWFVPIAIACGNAVVLKPSEKDPSASLLIAECWAEAGLPAGVFNVVHGDKVAVDGLLEHPDVAAVSFVGSTPIARYVYETGTRHGKRVQALGGAKNHMVVLPDADLDNAADAAVSAGFGSAGERCMAISVVVAVDPVGDELVPAIASRMAGLTTGDGRSGCDMGPLVTREHRDKVAGYLDAGVADGAELVVDGRGGRARRATPADSGSDPRCSTGYDRACRSTTTRSSAPCSRSSGRRRTTRHSRRQRLPVRQRHRHLHRRRRRRPPLPARRAGRDDRHQRPDPGADGLLLVRRLEGLALRRHPRPRHGRHPLLHPCQGRHLTLARPGTAHRRRPRVPAPRLTGPRRVSSAAVSGLSHGQCRHTGLVRAAVRTRYGGPGVVRFEDVPDPVAGRGEILVRVHATTVNRTDCAYRSGQPWLNRAFCGWPRPRVHVLGSEYAGVVVGLGEDVTSYAVGDRVFGFVDGRPGAHAEIVAVPADGLVASVPAGWDLADAAPGMEGAHYAHAFLRVTGLGPGHRALVHGATGGIGTAAVQLLHAEGVEVTAVCDRLPRGAQAS